MAAAEYFNPPAVNTPVHGPAPASYLGPPRRPSRASSPGASYHHPSVSTPSQLSPYDQPPPYKSPSLRPQNMQSVVGQKPLASMAQPALRRGSSQPVQPQYRPQVQFADPGSSPGPNPYTPPLQPQYMAQSHPNQQYFPQQSQTPYQVPGPYHPQQQMQRYQSPNQQAHSPYPPFPPQQQSIQPYGQPSYGYHPEQSSASLASEHGGYSSDPEAHRHGHRHRKHRTGSDAKKDHTSKSILGGAAGGLIGDLIFPGLGTVGGALAGFVGGREHSKRQEKKEEQRKLEQRKWEKRWSKGEYEREKPRFDDRF